MFSRHPLSTLATVSATLPVVLSSRPLGDTTSGHYLPDTRSTAMTQRPGGPRRGERETRRLTFAAAAAAPQTPPDNQADGVSCGRGLALLCCRGNGVLGRWRKWTSILRWETVTTEVAVSEFRSCLATMTKCSPADSKGAKNKCFDLFSNGTCSVLPETE